MGLSVRRFLSSCRSWRWITGVDIDPGFSAPISAGVGIVQMGFVMISNARSWPS